MVNKYMGAVVRASPSDYCQANWNRMAAGRTDERTGLRIADQEIIPVLLGT